MASGPSIGLFRQDFNTEAPLIKLSLTQKQRYRVPGWQLPWMFEAVSREHINFPWEPELRKSTIGLLLFRNCGMSITDVSPDCFCPTTIHYDGFLYGKRVDSFDLPILVLSLVIIHIVCSPWVWKKISVTMEEDLSWQKLSKIAHSAISTVFMPINYLNRQ